MSQRYRAAALGAIVAAALGAAAPTLGQARADAGDTVAGTESCLEQPSIRRTKILNGRNILFTTKSGQNYNNPLPRECPSLKRGSIVNYGVVSGRLCAGSTFQVLWQMGMDLMPTFLCQLGMFVPVTEAEVEDLLAVTDATPEGRKKRRRSSREMVTATPIEAPPAEPTAGEPAAAEAPPQND
jgi:hypothetical protein